jgi:hypothetical protein
MVHVVYLMMSALALVTMAHHPDVLPALMVVVFVYWVAKKSLPVLAAAALWKFLTRK